MAGIRINKDIHSRDLGESKPKAQIYYETHIILCVFEYFRESRRQGGGQLLEFNIVEMDFVSGWRLGGFP